MCHTTWTLKCLCVYELYRYVYNVLTLSLMQGTFSMCSPNVNDRMNELWYGDMARQSCGPSVICVKEWDFLEDARKCAVPSTIGKPLVGADWQHGSQRFPRLHLACRAFGVPSLHDE